MSLREGGHSHDLVRREHHEIKVGGAWLKVKHAERSRDILALRQNTHEIVPD